MNFKDFKQEYLKAEVVEYPNNRSAGKALLTVKVITYNHVDFIAECLDSILMQKTDFDFEILIGEDDSDDGTRDVCIEYAKKYPDKIRLLLNSRKNNITIDGRPTGTFNNVYLNYSIHSKYITLIEGDDYWTDKSSLQKRVDFLETNEDYVLCFHNSKIYHQADEKFDKRLLVPLNKSVTIEKNMILCTQTPTLTLLYRNNLVENFENNMIKIIAGDYILKGKLAIFGKGRYLQNVEASVYRVHKGGLWGGSTFQEKVDYFVAANLYLVEFYENRGLDTKSIFASLGIRFLNYFIYSLKNRKIRMDYFKQSIKYCDQSDISIFSACTEIFKNKIRKYK